MKLTTQQIAAIDETLGLNGLIYEDIKLEVTDHIASEIEATMNDNSLSFEVAFKQAFENWSEQLRPSSSLWVGSKNVAPKMVIQKMIFDTRKKLFIGFLFVFTLTLLLAIVVKKHADDNLIEIGRNILRGIYLLEVFLILGSKYIIWKSKIVTSYKLLFNNVNFAMLLLLVFLAIGIMPLLLQKDNIGILLASSFMASLYLFWPLYYTFIAYKHFQFENKTKFY